MCIFPLFFFHVGVHGYTIWGLLKIIHPSEFASTSITTDTKISSTAICAIMLSMAMTCNILVVLFLLTLSIMLQGTCCIEHTHMLFSILCDPGKVLKFLHVLSAIFEMCSLTQKESTWIIDQSRCRLGRTTHVS